MNRAEDLAKEFLKKLVSHATLYEGTIDELEVYEPDDVIWAYKEGYHQAEKDLELTWKDIADIENITTEILKECDNKILYDTEEGFCQEVLNRFNKLKGR